MKLIKLITVVFIGLISIIGLTVGWFLRIRAKAGGGGPIDILYVATRPLFLLELAAIVVFAVWLCRRWVFAS